MELPTKPPVEFQRLTVALESIILSVKLALKGLFACQNVRLGIVGHTHIAASASAMLDPYYCRSFWTSRGVTGLSYQELAVWSEKKQSANQKIEIPLKNSTSLEQKILFNPGAVGQPRDYSDLAAYGIINIDPEKVVLEWRFVQYDFEEAKRRIAKAGLDFFISTYDKFIS